MKPDNPSPAAHLVRYGIAVARGGFRVFLRHAWMQAGVFKDPLRAPGVAAAFDAALQTPDTHFALAVQPWTGALARALRRVARLFADEGLTHRFAEARAGAPLAPILNAFAALCAEMDTELETSGFEIRINESDLAILESLYPYLPQFAVDSGIGPARSWLPALFMGLMNASLWREVVGDPPALKLAAESASEFFGNLLKDVGTDAQPPSVATMEQAVTAFAPKSLEAAIGHLTWMLEPVEAAELEARVMPFLRAAFARDVPLPPVVAPVAPPPEIVPRKVVNSGPLPPKQNEQPVGGPARTVGQGPAEKPAAATGPAVDSLASVVANAKASANAVAKRTQTPAITKPAALAVPPPSKPAPPVMTEKNAPAASIENSGVAAPASGPESKHQEQQHAKSGAVEVPVVPPVAVGQAESAIAVVPHPSAPPLQPLQPVSKPASEQLKFGVQPIIPPRDDEDDELEDVEKAAVRDVRWIVGGVGIALIAITVFAVFGRGLFSGPREGPVDGPVAPAMAEPKPEPVKAGPEKIVVGPVEPLSEPVPVSATPIAPARLFEQAQLHIEAAGRAKTSGDNRQAAEDLSRALLLFKQELGDARWKDSRYGDLRNQYRAQLGLLEFSREQIAALEETLGAREPVEPEQTGEPGLAKMAALFKRGDEEVTNNRPRAAAEAYESGLRSGMEILGEKHLTDRVYQAHLSRYIDFLIGENLDPDELQSRLLLVKKGKKPGPLPGKRTDPESGGLGLPKL
ncbi:MAG: hypothetical protein RL088_1436 [Verrucomicrobiota bacterium]|jgi:hypothetical protein